MSRRSLNPQAVEEIGPRGGNASAWGAVLATAAGVAQEACPWTIIIAISSSKSIWLD